MSNPTPNPSSEPAFGRPLKSNVGAGRRPRRRHLQEALDRDNIDDDELTAFRAVAKSCAGLAEIQIAGLPRVKHFEEICRDDESKVQERCV